MATINLINKCKKDSANIYIRVKVGRIIDVSKSIGLSLPKEYWDTQKNSLKRTSKNTDYHNLSNKLNELKNLIQRELNNCNLEKIELTKDKVESIINKALGKEEPAIENELTYQIEKYIEIRRTNLSEKRISFGTIKNYKTTLSRLNKFQIKHQKAITLSKLNNDFKEEYIRFATEKLMLSKNSIAKDFSNIKAVCNSLKEKGGYINDFSVSKKFSYSKEKAKFVTLTENELDTISQYNGTESLENVRDWLIIGCYTGCRFNDLMNLSLSNISDYENNKILTYTQMKTNATVIVPLNKKILNILHKRSGFPRPISNAKFNDYIKSLCKLVGLTEIVEGNAIDEISKKKKIGNYEKWKLISSHICRRSFATIHYSKLSTKSIMKVTGHTSEKSFLVYIGKTEHDHLNDFFNLWGSK